MQFLAGAKPCEVGLGQGFAREDLNPMDQAKGILAYIQAKHPDKGYDVAGVMSELVNYDRSPDYVSEGFSDTVSEITKISAKSIRTTLRTI